MHEVSMYCMARTERRGYLGARGGSLKSQKTTWGVLCAVDTPACQVYPHSTITFTQFYINRLPIKVVRILPPKAIMEARTAPAQNCPYMLFCAESIQGLAKKMRDKAVLAF